MNVVLNTHLKVIRLAREGEFSSEEFDEFLNDVLEKRWNGEGMKIMRLLLSRHEVDILIETLQQHLVTSLQEFIDSFGAAMAA